MTTVGYGDKIPKSTPARLFSIIWIIIGITAFSIITATLTSEIYKVNNLPPPPMQDVRVGTIRHHTYEGILIANNGGVLVEVDSSNITDGIKHLVEMLHEKEIGGFVIDRYELLLFCELFADDDNFKDAVESIRDHMMLTELSHAEELMYGVLIKAEENYQFLSEFIQSNRDVISGCNSLFLRRFTRKSSVMNHQPSMNAMKGELYGPQMFWPAFLSCAVLVIIIGIFGFIYEVKIRYRTMVCNSETTNSDPTREEDNDCAGITKGCFKRNINNINFV